MSGKSTLDSSNITTGKKEGVSAKNTKRTERGAAMPKSCMTGKIEKVKAKKKKISITTETLSRALSPNTEDSPKKLEESLCQTLAVFQVLAEHEDIDSKVLGEDGEDWVNQALSAFASLTDDEDKIIGDGDTDWVL